jgi:hypothetical protein
MAAMVALLAADTALATLYALRNPGGGGRQVVTVDPETGSVIPLSDVIPPPLPSASGVIALDGPGGRFFFIAKPDGGSSIYTVDTATGALLSSTPLGLAEGAFINCLEYDDVNNLLLGVQNPGGGGRQLVIVDPTSGSVTAVGAVIDPPLLSASGVSSIDPLGQRLFFVGSPPDIDSSRLYTLDTQTGAVLSSPVIPDTEDGFVSDLEYDTVNNLLFALRNPGGGGRQVVLLDPSTAAVTPVSVNTSQLSSSSGSAALDAAGARFFFEAAPPDDVDDRIYTIDTQTGAMLHSPLIPGSGSAFLLGLAYYESDPVVNQAVIDVKPGSDTNPINPRSNGVIPVAVLTTSVADGDLCDFDAAAVDASSVRFGPDEAPIAHGSGHISDVDSDGDLDLLLHFSTPATGIVCGDTVVSLTGVTIGGEAFGGSDTIVTVGCEKVHADSFETGDTSCWSISIGT